MVTTLLVQVWNGMDEMITKIIYDLTNLFVYNNSSSSSSKPSSTTERYDADQCPFDRRPCPSSQKRQVIMKLTKTDTRFPPQSEFQEVKKGFRRCVGGLMKVSQ